MALQQINIGYDAQQDRLLVRMSTSECVEYRFWLTRRLVKGLWQGLIKLMQSSEIARRQAAPAAKHAVMEFEREAALQKTSFDKPYASEQMQPAMPGEPLLVFSIKMSANPQDGHDITLMPASGQGIHLKLSDTLLHGFGKLLQDTVTGSGWDLPLDLPAATVALEHAIN